MLKYSNQEESVKANAFFRHQNRVPQCYQLLIHALIVSRIISTDLNLHLSLKDTTLTRATLLKAVTQSPARQEFLRVRPRNRDIHLLSGCYLRYSNNFRYLLPAPLAFVLAPSSQKECRPCHHEDVNWNLFVYVF